MTTCRFDSIEAQASYGIGLQLGQQLIESGLTDIHPEALLAGLCDVLTHKPPVIAIESIHKALQKLQQRADAVMHEKMKSYIKQGEDYLTENARREGVKSTESGLQYQIIKQGNGAIPSKQDHVRVHYTGRLIDGTVFDSSYERGQPAEFPVNGVIAGWIEALSLMPVGSNWQLTIPYDLAYGANGAGSAIPPYSALIFDIELLDIV